MIGSMMINREVEIPLFFYFLSMVLTFGYDINFVWQKFKNIIVPFYSVAGNHDLRSMDSRREVEANNRKK